MLVVVVVVVAVVAAVWCWVFFVPASACSLKGFGKGIADCSKIAEDGVSRKSHEQEGPVGFSLCQQARAVLRASRKA